MRSEARAIAESHLAEVEADDGDRVLPARLARPDGWLDDDVLPAILPCRRCDSEGRVWDDYFHLWRTCSWCDGQGRLVVAERLAS